MRRTGILCILVMALLVVVPAAPASAQPHVLSKGTFVGFVNVDCGQAPITSFTCSVSGSSTLCVEVVAGTAIGGSCSVSFSGEVNGVGTSTACLAFGLGGGSVGSRTGGYGHDGLITMDGTIGTYEGQGGAGATGVVVELEFAATGCGTPIVDGPMRGSFVTHISP